MNVKILFALIVGAMLVAPASAMDTRADYLHGPEFYSFSSPGAVYFLVVNPTTDTVSVTDVTISTQNSSVGVVPVIVKVGEIAQYRVNISLPAEVSFSGTARYSKKKDIWTGQLITVNHKDKISGSCAVVSSGTYWEDIDTARDFEISEVDLEIFDAPYVIPGHQKMQWTPIIYRWPFLSAVHVADCRRIGVYIFNPTGEDIYWNNISVYKRSSTELSFSEEEGIPEYINFTPEMRERIETIRNQSEIDVYLYGYTSIPRRETELGRYGIYGTYIYSLVIVALLICVFWLSRYIRRQDK